MADNASADSLTVTVPSFCTLGGVVDTAHSTTLSGGQYTENIGKTTLKAFCNDVGGYAIYAIGTSGGTDGDTDLISDIRNDYNIQTGLATTGGVSAWAMKLTAGTVTNPTTGVESTPPQIASDTEGGFDEYHTVPDEWTRVAYRGSETDMNADITKTGSYVTTTYRVYIANTQPAGSYVGQVKYALIHPDDGSATLTSLKEAFDAAYEGDEASHQKTVDGVAYYTMQSMAPAICNAANLIGEVSQMQLVDARDDSIYWVTKLEDGWCWMTQNLAIDLDSTGALALNSLNTDINQYGSNGYNSANGYTCSNEAADCAGGTITWVPERSTIDGRSNLNSTNWVNDYYNPYSYNPGATAIVDENGLAEGHRLSGNYYNWTAAIASNYSGGFSQNTLADISGNPKNSVCPKGWRLPTISDETGYEVGSTNEFRRLNILYNGNVTNNPTKLMNAPLYLARSGCVLGGSLLYAGSSGYYWSSTVKNGSYSYRWYFNSSIVNPENDVIYREYGFSVRCVAR